MNALRNLSETLARTTSRRGLFGWGAEVATRLLIGAAAGTLARPQQALAGPGATVCGFPGPPCPCDGCQTNGVCGKPCIISQCCYASGCCVTSGVTCCDCDCRGFEGIGVCGCGSDYHNNPAFCPN